MSEALLADVYHSGDDRHVEAPFLMVRTGETELPAHPIDRETRWSFWKSVPLRTIAVEPSRATDRILEAGYFIQ